MYGAEGTKLNSKAGRLNSFDFMFQGIQRPAWSVTNNGNAPPRGAVSSFQGVREVKMFENLLGYWDSNKRRRPCFCFLAPLHKQSNRKYILISLWANHCVNILWS